MQGDDVGRCQPGEGRQEKVVRETVQFVEKSRVCVESSVEIGDQTDKILHTQVVITTIIHTTITHLKLTAPATNPAIPRRVPNSTLINNHLLAPNPTTTHQTITQILKPKTIT